MNLSSIQAPKKKIQEALKSTDDNTQQLLSCPNFEYLLYFKASIELLTNSKIFEDLNPYLKIKLPSTFPELNLPDLKLICLLFEDDEIKNITDEISFFFFKKI